ncbi:MAG: 3-deoxy-7-phosphoheptulonate synthase [Anaerovoracaceae bacterium]|jgi:3-deoxy-7-phosphoheptulonate synthase
MILVLKADAGVEEIAQLEREMQGKGMITQDIVGEHTHMIGLAGDVSSLDSESLERLDIIERVIKVSEPYKLSGRRFHPTDTVIEVGPSRIGGGDLTVMAGPCSIESEEQILSIAQAIKHSGATFLRGGAFKPRSSPYSFQGMGLDGLELLKMAREKTGLPIVSEIMSLDTLEIFQRDVDVIQIGARSMQNFPLLKEVGRLNKPVLLKRGLSNTIDELLQAADYILIGGKSDVILCERGIRTFETATRNTLDLSAVPVLKKKSHLPIIVDPSHGTGHWDLVESMSLAAVAAGADGLMIEVHNQPQQALCDGQQSITPILFHRLMKKIHKVHAVINEKEGES